MRIGLWAIAVFLIYSSMSGTYGIPRIIRLELERRSLIETNQELLLGLIDADRTRRLLTEDPDYIEYIARTRYHLAHPNETIYRYSGQ
jgi:cell division protein FtsB